MKELKELVDRYDVSCHCGAVDVRPKQDGHLVMYSDYVALEQRAEAAEAECARLDKESRNLSTQLGGCDRERRSALRELAELNKQKPVGTVSISMDWNTHRNIATVNMRPDLVVAEMKDGDELFTRPAPAISLVELVPDYLLDALCRLDLPGVSIGDKAIIGKAIEVLRNIEEQSR